MRSLVTLALKTRHLLAPVLALGAFRVGALGITHFGKCGNETWKWDPKCDGNEALNTPYYCGSKSPRGRHDFAAFV